MNTRDTCEEPRFAGNPENIRRVLELARNLEPQATPELRLLLTEMRHVIEALRPVEYEATVTFNGKPISPCD